MSNGKSHDDYPWHEVKKEQMHSAGAGQVPLAASSDGFGLLR
jgi:hypothetical protein